MPPKRGHGNRGARGGANRGGGHRGGATQNNTPKTPKYHVARPAVLELPTSLRISPSVSPIPSQITEAFPEFKKPQPFFSALERLQPEFGGSPTRSEKCWLGIPEERIVSVTRESESPFYANLVLSDTSGNTVNQPVFVKRIHIIDPICAMEGEYVLPGDGALPAPSDLWRLSLKKLNDPMNEAYVDTLFAAIAHRFVESKLSPHWCRSFGTFNARVDTYLFNISEEYDSMRREPWWFRNQRLGLFKLHADTKPPTSFIASDALPMMMDDFETVEDNDTAPASSSDAPVLVEEPLMDSETEPVSLTGPKVQIKQMKPVAVSEAHGLTDSADSSDSGTTDSSASSTSEIEEHHVEFKNFPVQVTLLERAEGTLEDLMEDEDEEGMLETKESRWTAWLFQIIAALSAAQHWFGFVHNDLHSNNVMWSPTTQSHIVYRVHKGKSVTFMRVPTFGKLMKIIDFGRASFHLPDPAGFFISDAFFPGNDAATQYNCEPFLEDGKKVEPNPSFDLCRLSVSMLESLYPERPGNVSPVKVMSREGGKLYTETVSAVYNMLWEWLQDDTGRNVLREPNGSERYPDFELYRVLAAEVHKAVPALQIEKALFTGYRTDEKDIAADSDIYDLWI